MVIRNIGLNESECSIAQYHFHGIHKSDRVATQIGLFLFVGRDDVVHTRTHDISRLCVVVRVLVVRYNWWEYSRNTFTFETGSTDTIFAVSSRYKILVPIRSFYRRLDGITVRFVTSRMREANTKESNRSLR